MRTGAVVWPGNPKELIRLFIFVGPLSPERKMSVASVLLGNLQRSERNSTVGIEGSVA